MPEPCPHCNIPLHCEIDHPNIQLDRCPSCNHLSVSVSINHQRISIKPALSGILIHVFHPNDETSITDAVSRDGQPIRFIMPVRSWLAPYPQSPQDSE